MQVTEVTFITLGILLWSIVYYVVRHQQSDIVVSLVPLVTDWFVSAQLWITFIGDNELHKALLIVTNIKGNLIDLYFH
jgi:hypothetical protein